MRSGTYANTKCSYFSHFFVVTCIFYISAVFYAFFNRKVHLKLSIPPQGSSGSGGRPASRRLASSSRNLSHVVALTSLPSFPCSSDGSMPAKSYLSRTLMGGGGNASSVFLSPCAHWISPGEMAVVCWTAGTSSSSASQWSTLLSALRSCASAEVRLSLFPPLTLTGIPISSEVCLRGCRSTPTAVFW